jgi:hypothetical protein
MLGEYAKLQKFDGNLSYFNWFRKNQNLAISLFLPR